MQAADANAKRIEIDNILKDKSLTKAEKIDILTSAGQSLTNAKMLVDQI